MGKRKTKEKFINDGINLYGDKYDYSLINYINNKTKVKIICPVHGEFEQTPDKFLYTKRGCGKCDNYGVKNIDNHRKTLIERMINIHGDKYDYSKVVYINNSTKVKIICPEHGEFEQTPNNHLSGYGCQTCGGTKKLNSDDFIKKAKLIHGDKYDYSLVEYVNYNTKVDIICPEHGIFKQTLIKHCNRKNGCPICKESKGEKQIRVFLSKNKIKFIQQHRFLDCKNKHSLPFDFYLPEHNMCIEFNGIQHYESVKYFGGENKLKEQKINDKIKMEFCVNNDLEIFIIKYNENIITKLNKLLKYEI